MNKLNYAIIWALLIGIGLVIILPNGMHHNTLSSIWTQHTGDIMSWGNTTTTGVEFILWNTNSLVYTNTEYWFQLTLPTWWEDYTGIIYKKFEWWTGVVAGIDIALPTDSQWPGVENPNNNQELITWYAGMIRIYVRTDIWYQSLLEQCMKNMTPVCWMINDVLLKGKYVYTIIWPQDLPTDLYKKFDFWTYYNEIKNNFKILN